MKQRALGGAFGILFFSWLLVPVQANPEAFEVGARQTDELPGGKEADGIVADW